MNDIKPTEAKYTTKVYYKVDASGKIVKVVSAKKRLQVKGRRPKRRDGRVCFDEDEREADPL